jgi:hypothetical protein
MNETYAFLAIFTLQILAGSVVCPALFIRRLLANVASFPAERFAELFPGVDKDLSAERFTTRYRALNTGIAVLGLLLLGWLFTYTRHPDWNVGKVQVIAMVYFLAQASPITLVGWRGARYSRMLKHSLEQRKRKAVLQRRGLFDFVSPFTVCLAALTYFLFAALVLYMIRETPFPRSAGLFLIGITTLVYALNAFVAFGFLYGKRGNPLQTHADRVHLIGTAVRNCVHACIAATLFMSLDLTLILLHWNRWEPAALSGFFVITILLNSKGVIAPPRQPRDEWLGADGPLPPATRDLSA